ncbi:MAG TPA: hypothetical protein VER17_02040 [Tepidisphaeraceae bacterium]|nr:hypothetical protein [Tepidisphaeraceae bacterium]
MRKHLLGLCVAALLVGGASFTAVAQDKPAAEKKTVEGELVDLHCYAAGGAKGEKHGQSCGQKCAKSGIPVAILADGKTLTLATNPRPLSDAVGKTVRVTGTANAEASTFVPDKVEVKDGESWKEIKMNDAHHKGGEEKA